MSQYNFVATGNFVDFYENDVYVIKLHKTSRCITWVFSDIESIQFQIDEMVYYTNNISDISFGGVPCSSQEDFRTNITSMFPLIPAITTLEKEAIVSPAAGLLVFDTDLFKYCFWDGGLWINLGNGIYSGSGSLPWAVDVNANGHIFNIVNGDVPFLTIDPSENQEFATLQSNNSTDGGNVGMLQASTTATNASLSLSANFNAGAKVSSIAAVANATTATIEFISDTYKLNGISAFADNAAAVAGGLTAGMLYRTGDDLKIVH